MLGYLAGAVSPFSANARHWTAAINLPGRQILILAICGVAVAILLWIPVLGDRLNATLAISAPKVLKRLFLVGAVVLVAGLVTGFGLLTIIGGVLMGIVVLAVIVDNY